MPELVTLPENSPIGPAGSKVWLDDPAKALPAVAKPAQAEPEAPKPHHRPVAKKTAHKPA